MERLGYLIYSPRDIKEEKKGISQISGIPYAVLWCSETWLDWSELDLYQTAVKELS
jgi:hypothetical protein